MANNRSKPMAASMDKKKHFDFPERPVVPGKPHIFRSKTYDCGWAYYYWTCFDGHAIKSSSSKEGAYKSWKDWTDFVARINREREQRQAGQARP